MIKSAILVISLCMFSSCRTAGSNRVVYYDSVAGMPELWVAHPLDPITKAEADRRSTAGENYCVATYDSRNRLIFVEAKGKYGHNIASRRYFYQKNKAYKRETTTFDGKTSVFECP